MPTIHFLGKIMPSSHNSTTTWGLPTVHFTLPDIGISGDLNIHVKGSSMDVECIVDRFDRENLMHIHNFAYDLARAAINLVAFSTGIILTIIFDQFVDAEGVCSPFCNQAPLLASLCTAYSLEASETNFAVGDIVKIIFTEQALFLALDDLITATSHHHLLTVNSARAIEGLRNAMAPLGIPRSQAWELFRTNLNVSESYLRIIIDNSKSGRHGETKPIPGTVTAEIIRRSWIIMNRFLEFRKRRNRPLEEAEFPTLLV